MLTRGEYVIEVHDLHPAALADLSPLIERLPPAARAAAAYLVVPAWHGAHPLSGHSELAARVNGWGGDLVLHGLTHLRSASPVWNAWTGLPDERECARWSGDDAERLVREGLRLCEDAFGRRPSWFCAPRWIQPPAVTRALGTCGVSWHMRRDGYVGADGRRVELPVVFFDAGPRWWHRLATLAAARARLHRHLGNGRPFRLAVHPRDCAVPARRRRLLGTVAALNRGGWTARALARAVAR